MKNKKELYSSFFSDFIKPAYLSINVNESSTFIDTFLSINVIMKLSLQLGILFLVNNDNGNI